MVHDLALNVDDSLCELSLGEQSTYMAIALIRNYYYYFIRHAHLKFKSNP